MVKNCLKKKKSRLRLHFQKSEFSKGRDKVIEMAGAGIRIVLVAIDSPFVQDSECFKG